MNQEENGQDLNDFSVLGSGSNQGYDLNEVAKMHAILAEVYRNLSSSHTQSQSQPCSTQPTQNCAPGLRENRAIEKETEIDTRDLSGLMNYPVSTSVGVHDQQEQNRQRHRDQRDQDREDHIPSTSPLSLSHHHYQHHPDPHPHSRGHYHRQEHRKEDNQGNDRGSINKDTHLHVYNEDQRELNMNVSSIGITALNSSLYFNNNNDNTDNHNGNSSIAVYSSSTMASGSSSSNGDNNTNSETDNNNNNKKHIRRRQEDEEISSSEKNKLSKKRQRSGVGDGIDEDNGDNEEGYGNDNEESKNKRHNGNQDPHPHHNNTTNLSDEEQELINAPNIPSGAELDFALAIFFIGLKYSSPKVLMEWMPNIESLTTEHIKSHLQKYRLNKTRPREEFESIFNLSIKPNFDEFLLKKAWQNQGFSLNGTTNNSDQIPSPSFQEEDASISGQNKKSNLPNKIRDTVNNSSQLHDEYGQEQLNNDHDKSVDVFYHLQKMKAINEQMVLSESNFINNVRQTIQQNCATMTNAERHIIQKKLQAQFLAPQRVFSGTGLSPGLPPGTSPLINSTHPPFQTNNINSSSTNYNNMNMNMMSNSMNFPNPNLLKRG